MRRIRQLDLSRKRRLSWDRKRGLDLGRKHGLVEARHISKTLLGMTPQTVFVRKCLSTQLTDVTPDVVVPVDVRQIAEFLQKLLPAVLADVLAADLVDRYDVIRKAELLAEGRVAQFADVRPTFETFAGIARRAERLKRVAAHPRLSQKLVSLSFARFLICWIRSFAVAGDFLCVLLGG